MSACLFYDCSLLLCEDRFFEFGCQLLDRLPLGSEASPHYLLCEQIQKISSKLLVLFVTGEVYIF